MVEGYRYQIFKNMILLINGQFELEYWPVMYDYNTKDQSMRMTPEGLVNWHPEGRIRNANVPECYNHIICALKNGKKTYNAF